MSHQGKASLKNVLASSAFLLVFALSGSGQADDLWQIYLSALHNDSKLKSALHRKESALEAVPQSRASLLPSANLSAQQGRYQQNTMDNNRYDSKGFALTLQVPVYHRDRLFSLDMAKADAQVAELTYAMEQQEQLMRVAERYFNVLSAEESLQVALAEEAAMRRQMELAKESLAAGTAVITELQEAQSGMDFATAQLIAARNMVDARKRELLEIIGAEESQQPLTLQPLKKEIPLKAPEPAAAEQWVRVGQESSFALKIARIKREQANQAVEKAKSGHYPTIDATAGHNYNDSTGSNYWTGGVSTYKTDYLLLQMNVPIFSGGATQSQVRQAIQAREAMQQEWERSQKELETTIRNAYLDVQTGIAQSNAFAQAFTSASSMLQTTRESYAAGMRTMLDVLAAERDLFRAMRNLADARYRYILGALRLKFTAGQLGEQDLSHINEWLSK
ncbi:TolC family outer membrane protein [Candidatus Magnetaquicoccus inordinatus]|uniref:TolC family outer membrane protein n=1 Tax=Candidatus Magnetaquicoccus inordinatus TaxID=2496818 RepID=UPI00102BE6AE|nr:TolC family outer membrane protein [Candidatus Magnetaquicoccus inordinatus]